ncbi:hypothetical protein [Nocardia jinanensis]|uniref:Uncharacterized protein n=1 Tax=Nocardia jinanensis TaxID=382504 RepID=A0A917VM70_9NOCA|nr:hypothetical protein [Nocardia jinanensis]GGK95255.1 hypothetical protein GCM10011588_06950 [Nocardia jinanensis]
MNTAISVTGTDTREDVSARVRPGPVPPGAAGTAASDEGGLPGPDTWPDRPSRPCGTATYRDGTGGYRPIARPPAPVVRRGPAVRPLSRPPEPGELVERARAGYAATALTAVISATVVVAFLALAHLRAPDPAPQPIPSGIPGPVVPGPGTDAPGSR